VDLISGRKLVICADGRNGHAGRVLGISDECIHHSTGAYGALAALDRPSQTLVPRPELRVHNLSFDLSAYVTHAYEDDGKTNFTLKIFGNSKYRFLALAVNKCDSKVVKALRTVLDKSVSIVAFLNTFSLKSKFQSCKHIVVVHMSLLVNVSASFLKINLISNISYIIFIRVH